VAGPDRITFAHKIGEWPLAKQELVLTAAMNCPDSCAKMPLDFCDLGVNV